MEAKKQPEAPPAEDLATKIDPRGLIFEHFWAAMMERQNVIGHQIEESDKVFQRNLEERKRQMEESDRRFKLYMEERNRQLKESDSKFYHEIEESRKKFYDVRGQKYHDEDEDYDDDSGDDESTGKRKGKKGAKKQSKGKGSKAGGRAGGRAESIASSGITKQFSQLGFKFDDISPNRKLLDGNGSVKAEIDIIMESPDCIMAVAIIESPGKKDIDNHVKRMFMVKDHYAAKSNSGKYMDRRKIYGAIMADDLDDNDKLAIYEAGFYVLEQGGKAKAPEGFIPHEW
jgi:hypothetical protein